MNLSDEINGLLDEASEKPVHLIFSSKEKALDFKKSIDKNDVRGKASVRKTKGWKTHSLVFNPHSYADVVAIMKMYRPEKGSYKDIARDVAEADEVEVADEPSALAMEIEALIGEDLADEIDSLTERDSGGASFSKLTSGWRRQSADMLMFATKLRLAVNTLRKTPGYEGKGRPGIAELERGADQLAAAIKSIGDGVKKMSMTTFLEDWNEAEGDEIHEGKAADALLKAVKNAGAPVSISDLASGMRGMHFAAIERAAKFLVRQGKLTMKNDSSEGPMLSLKESGEMVESESAIAQAFAYELRPWLINQLEGVLKGLDREMLMMKKGKWPKPRMEYGITRYRPNSMVHEDFMTQVINEYRKWRGDLTQAMGKR